MRLVLISDTHGWHEDVVLPEGDVLIHCGDLVTDIQVGIVGLKKIDDWFGRQPFEHILCTGGNHDRALERFLAVGNELENATPLIDTSFHHDGVHFFGAPWIPHLKGWAYSKDDSELAHHWSLIPEDVDVLLTHTPPAHILDISSSGFGGLGCRLLAERVKEVCPKLHCFGHIHASYGQLERDGTRYVNAALAGGRYPYGIVNEPVVVDL